MVSRSIQLFLGLTVATYLLTAASAALAAGEEPCQAPVDPKLKGGAVSDKLKRCNGVLKPGKAADPDIIVPTPAIDDPLTIHPKQVPNSNIVPK